METSSDTLRFTRWKTPEEERRGEERRGEEGRREERRGEEMRGEERRRRGEGGEGEGREGGPSLDESRWISPQNVDGSKLARP